MRSSTFICAALSLSLFVLFPSILRAEQESRQSPLGLNLSHVVDYSSEMPFVDVFMHSRRWISQAVGKRWGTGPELELTEQGWIRRLQPGQYATALMCWAGGNPQGRYICLYQGKGEIDFKGVRVVRRSPGRIELEVAQDGRIMLNLLKTDPNDPVRDIHVIMPGFEDKWQKDPFYPHFVNRCRQFRVIRFMDWMETNGSEIREWSQRPRPTDSSQARKGVSLEYMIALCNKLEADPWFCMPHLASDDYIRQFALMTKEKLGPDRKIYLEHSNEVWNGQFPQAQYAARRGRELKLSNNAFQAQLFYHSKRSVEIFKIWEDVFGGTGRLVRVLGSQSANPWVSEQVMTFNNAWKQADAIAIAPYFGGQLGRPNRASQTVKMSLDQIFRECRKSIAENRKKIEAVVAMADKAHLQVISYEGGQHLVGAGPAQNNEALTKLFISANRDPRMKQLYLEDLASWKAAGGKLFTVFSSVAHPSKYGSWGMLETEHQETNTAPKYQAITEFIRKNRAWWKE